MPPYEVNIDVFFRDGVVDPQSRAIESTIQNFDESLENRVSSLRLGKKFTFIIDAVNKRNALKDARNIGNNLFSNPLIEEATIDIKLYREPAKK